MLPEVDAYIEQFDSVQANILQHIRTLILNSHPAMQEKFIYKTPFYCLNKNLCYLTFHKKRKRFVIGFIQGYNMPDPYDLLMSEDNQLYIRHLVIDANNLDLNTISEYLQFAIELQLQKVK